MSIVAYLLARLSEPSSYAGLGAMMALLGWSLPDGAVAQLAQLLAAACGLLALLLKERGLIPVVLLACVLLPGLTACAGVPAAAVGGLGAAGVAYAAVDRVTEQAGSYIGEGCAVYEKAKSAADAVLAAGTMSPAVAAKVTAVESFGDAACANPPAGDPLSTAIWLGRLAGQIGTLVSASS
ncbi:MAG TPA: hypothetical protein VFX06_07450 [Stellaceae bacterium]|nr:hypothetical protein [Stellaceae bacterium]